MSLTSYARSVQTRVDRMVVIVASLQRHLEREQNDVIAPASSMGNRAGSGAGGINDPTWRAVQALAPFAAIERDARRAIQQVDQAIDAAEQAVARILGQSARMNDGPPGHDEPRCPGWNAELRARLGGCGNHLETWRDAKGAAHVRSSWLCVSCRKASERAERELGAA